MRSKSKQQTNKTAGVRLRLESLESRVCPSVSVSTIPIQGGNELLIVGDNNANTIDITDQGDGHIDVVNGKGKILGSADGITLVKLEGKNGQDTVNYALANTLTNTERVVLDLGKKADSATIDLSKGISGANLHLKVEGGAGADSIAVTLGSLTASKEHITLDGGDGADSISVTGSEANVDATSLLALAITGGAGKDTLTHDVQRASAGKSKPHCRRQSRRRHPWWATLPSTRAVQARCARYRPATRGRTT